MKRIAVVAALSAFAFALTLAPTPAGAKKRPKHDPDTKPPVITHVRVSKAPRDKELMIRARFEDESEIFAPTLNVREKGAPEFESLPMRQVENGYEAAIPAAKMGKDLEYFIEVFDEEGNGPAREGSPEAPLAIAVFDPGAVLIEKNDPPPADDTAPPPKFVPKPEDKPKDSALTGSATGRTTGGATTGANGAQEDDNIATTWWFWTIIGVAVTGAVAGSVVLLQSGGGGPVDAVDIQVIGPDPRVGI